MNTIVRALIWELVWKNRVVFPALVLLFAVGAALGAAVSQAPPDAAWTRSAVSWLLVTFLASVFLGFAPFTLMESQEGWRMNSMTTHWFVLPVHTRILVAVPLVLAWCLATVLMAAWSSILSRYIPVPDLVYLLLVLMVAMAATQALAWALPRRPGQCWLLSALLFLAALIFSPIPIGSAGWPGHRLPVILVLTAVLPAFGVFIGWIASRSRSGAGAGETSFDTIGNRIWRRPERIHEFRRPTSALAWSDSLPLLRSLVLGWFILVVLLTGYVCLVIMLFHRGRPLDLRWMAFAALDVLPRFGVFGLAIFGMFLGAEPATGFRTRLSSFRATLPVTAARWASMRIAALAGAWIFIWAPLVALYYLSPTDYTGIPRPMAQRLFLEGAAGLAWKMAISAHLLAGALPVLLRGRFEGFPTLLLASICAWAWTWLLTGFFNWEEVPGWSWLPVAALLAVKFGGAAWFLGRSCRQGQTTWRFAVALISGWLGVTSILIWVLPFWQVRGAWGAAAIALLVPLARLAGCPLAVAANRHR